jgi:drug/metabolite transporter (DMT)-like permease
MGGWLFLGFAFHTIGVATTTAQRSGFLLYLNVKFVPFFGFLFFRRHITISTWISAMTAFAGTALLAYDGTSWTINQGDAWCIAAAAASAMYILRLDAASNAVGSENSVKLNAACLWVVTLLSGIWSMATTSDSSLLQEIFDIALSHPLELIYLSAVTTALANFIQTRAQKDVTAERASVIYAMDPVYGAFFSNLLLGETLTGLGYCGASLITIAAATNAFFDLSKDKAETTRKGQ